MPKRRFLDRLPEKSSSRSRVVASLIWRLLESGPASLGICCLLIAFVSVHDAALIVTNHEVIYEMEQNPIGVWLLDLQDGQVWLFVTVKLICTALVCAVLITLYKHQRRMAMTVAASLVCFQLSLLCYLSVA
ncbi:hypothetical protein [Planctomycetes bacterium TBK1r]|uniref:DUF5658 domain-containing protein n=1 Tax=Stieleria magnilauensis TaxID=2527963 RepID=A0ABX5XRB6_9BACT|nr:hypothetical protein TBK1r_34900 [Planctomycetes bacterium TBK1r]